MLKMIALLSRTKAAGQRKMPDEAARAEEPRLIQNVTAEDC